MPLYEYRCAAGHRYEKIQSFSAPEQLECPRCGLAGERLLSAPAIQFKGSGFYLTDYGKAGGGKPGASESGSSSDAKTNSASKPGSDSKPVTDSSKSSTSAPASTPASSSPANSAAGSGSSGTTSSGSTSSSS